MKGIAAVALAAVLLAGPAFADTDYQCLKQCKRQGDSSQDCMEKCTYKPQRQQKGLKGAKKDSHDQFTTMHSAGRIMLKPPQQTPEKPEKDYNCVNACLKSGMQYQMCGQRCLEQTSR